LHRSRLRRGHSLCPLPPLKQQQQRQHQIQRNQFFEIE
jgi:hypothetical protein